MKSEIHAVTFDKQLFNVTKAKAWLKRHNINFRKIEKHIKPNIIWANVTNKNKYKRFSTIKTSDGVNLIFGWY